MSVKFPEQFNVALEGKFNKKLYTYNLGSDKKLVCVKLWIFFIHQLNICFGCLERGPLMWMMPLHLHVNQKSDYDMMIYAHKNRLIETVT